MSKSSAEYVIVFTKRSTKVDSPKGRFPRIPFTADSVLDSEFIACVPGTAQIISVSEHVVPSNQWRNGHDESKVNVLL